MESARVKSEAETQERQALVQHRQQFPALANKGYFNYGGQGPMATAALQAIAQTYEQIQTLGPFSGAANRSVMALGETLRGAIAAALQVTPETITLTEDVTVGCNIALWGFDWQPGDQILMTDCEHPGIIATIQELQRRFGIEPVVCPVRETLNQGDPVARIAAALTPKTRLVVLSHILWNTGQVLSLEAIVQACHRYTAAESVVRVLVDAAQSVGVLPLDLAATDVDFYAFTGHKWWCGPEGVGGLYVSPAAREDLHPTYVGWRGILMDAQGNPTGWKPDGRRYEVATSAYPLYAGLLAALEVQTTWGTATERYQRICALSHQVWQGLQTLSGVHCLHQKPPEAGLVAFQIESQKHQALVLFLEQQGFATRVILDPNCVRVGVHYLTLESEIESLIACVADGLPTL